MTSEQILALLEQVRAGATSPAEAAALFAGGSVAELDFATLDLDRQNRCGFPEVILAEGKTAEWTVSLVQRLSQAGQSVFVTRINEEQSAALTAAVPHGEQDRLARTFWLPSADWKPLTAGRLVVVTAGTSDLPVAQEALVTAQVMGAPSEMVVDVGVAGLHRILKQRHRLENADVVIVVAGMDGALPSVVGGLVSCPVIAVPTSTGYGAAFGGVAALLTMLNSCSAGVVAVNIDAGFKAGYVAARMIHRIVAAKEG